MRYDEFRQTLAIQLHQARLLFFGDPTQTLDLRDTSRRWEVFLEGKVPDSAAPFHVGATVSFQWDPFQSARTYTTEEDLLDELLGRGEEPYDTMPRELRVDYVLKASLPWDTLAPMPDAVVWRRWSRSVHAAIELALHSNAPDHFGDSFVITDWSGTVKVKSRCSAEGEIHLGAVSLPSWRCVVLPRVRDGEDEDPGVDVDRQLEALAGHYRKALEAWSEHVVELRQAIDVRDERNR